MILVAVVSVGATWLLMRGERRAEPAPVAGEQAPVESPREEVAPAPAPPTGLRLVHECMVRLDAVEGALDRCQQGDPPVVAEGAAAESCLADPGIQAAIERAVGRELERRIERIRDREQTAKAATELAIDDWAKGLGLSSDQREWMRDYVCSLEELRARALDALVAEDAPPAEVLTKLREQREAVLADLEDKLGSDRYSRLRDLGGIGLLRDSIECA